MNLRDAIRDFSPPWLQAKNAGALLWAIALNLDALLDATVAGVKMRFPGLYSFESLPTLGRDRRIRRGRTDSNAVYAARLQRWLTDHRTRGGAYALLRQLREHYAPAAFPIHLVYKNGKRFVLDVDGNITTDFIPPPNPPAQWARWTLFFFTEEWPTPESVTADDKNDLVLIPKEWIAAHPIGKLVLMPTGVELWNYHVPARKWNNHSKWNKSPGTKLEI